MTDIADLGAGELVKAVRCKDVSPVEVVQASLQRIDDGKVLNAFMAVCAERALAEAKAAEGRIMSGEEVGPLHGIPFSVK